MNAVTHITNLIVFDTEYVGIGQMGWVAERIDQPANHHGSNHHSLFFQINQFHRFSPKGCNIRDSANMEG